MSQAIYKQIRDINDKLDKLQTQIDQMINVQDVLTEKEAAAFLGVSYRTLQNHYYAGRLVGKYTINALGHRMYYKSKLIEHF